MFLPNEHKLKLPSDLKSKPLHTQLLRLSLRLAPHSMGVDTLHKTLSTILENFNIAKYRTIDVRGKGFTRAFEGVPGAHDFLETVGFVASGGGNKGLLTLSQSTDSLVLTQGLSVLEDLKSSNWEYQLDRQLRLFDKEILKATTNPVGMTSDEVAKEDARRSGFLRLTPSDPGKMNCSMITITLGSGKQTEGHNSGGGSRGGSRNFSADDTLGDVLNWLGATYGPRLYDKIVSGTWVLINLDKREGDEGKYLDVKGDDLGSWTLHRLGFWPSGRLGVRGAREM